MRAYVGNSDGGDDSAIREVPEMESIGVLHTKSRNRS